MTDGEKLSELLEPHMSGSPCEHECGICEGEDCRSCNARFLARHLIDNGVVVREKGEWTVLDECANEGAYCSVCHKKVYKVCYGNCKMKSNFCPNCGADMR